jgi:anti-sigma factor RsiW
LNEHDTQTDHGESELVGAYVLDALEESERDAFEAHLLSCIPCRSEVEDLLQVVEVLPLAVERAEPSDALKTRLFDAVAEESATGPRLIVPRGAVPTSGWRRGIRRYETILVLAAAVVIAALGAWNVHLQNQVSAEKRTAASGQAVSRALLSGASVSTLAPTGTGTVARAALVQPKNGAASYLLIGDLPAAPKHKVYELWYLRGTTPYRVTVFNSSSSAPTVVPLPTATNSYGEAAITVENGPNGSDRPTSAPIMTGKLSA